MPRQAIALTALTVSRLKTPGLKFVGTVPGLALQVVESGARTWILRVSVGGKRRDMGLGGYPAVTLAQAHQKARTARDKIEAGVDPIEDAREAKSRLAAAQASAVTFEEAARRYMAAHESSWRNVKHAKQWRSTLTTYAFPVMGTMLVRHIETQHVLEVLEPIWKTTTETAKRLRSRIELVLDWATARGYRDGLNPARWRGHLATMLAKPSKVSKPKHFPALPVNKLGDFMQRLRTHSGTGAKALEFAILTAARSGEVRGARWTELNIETGLWTIPASRMKVPKEHKVPLSRAALKILKVLPRIAGSDLVFPAPRGGQLSDMTLTAVLRRMEEPVTVHGFRSTFRDWSEECTNYPANLAEMALAHAIGNKVEAAYRRGDLLDKRRLMMADWAVFCSAPASGKVVKAAFGKKVA